MIALALVRNPGDDDELKTVEHFTSLALNC